MIDHTDETTPAGRRDRVRRNTAAEILRRIDDDTEQRLLHSTGEDRGAVAARLHELDREWDTDRTIELEAAATGLVGLALGAFVRAPLLAIPAVVGAALVVHAVTGRYPLMPVLRRMGVRTSREIARERYALKTLRGDFAALGAVRASGDGREAA